MRYLLDNEPQPTWYEIDFFNNQLTLRIHSDFIDKTEAISPTAPIVKGFQEKHGLKDFACEGEEGFGFGGALPFIEKKDDFFIYQIPMPRRFVPTEETCKQCEGSGENDWGDGDCSSCYGEGKEISDEYLKLFEVSASLTILFIWLSSPQIETGAATSQVMCVQTHSDIGMHGSSIGGAFSSELSSYLAVMPENTLLTEIKKATKQAYENMMGDRLEYFQDDFQSYVGENGYLVINCIGDACQVHNDTHSYDKGRSRGFTCHNVDNAEQQLTLLAGLGRLHRLFRNATQEIQDVAGSASS